MSGPLDALRGGLVVSCQASEGSPLRAPEHLAALARAAEQGGAVGIRAEGGPALAAIGAAVGLPVIGLRKRAVAGTQVYITPELEDAEEVAAAGAAIVAADATLRPRPGGTRGDEFVAVLVRELELPVLADVDGLEAGLAAEAAGAAALATTLAGYTAGGPAPTEPDVELVEALAGRVGCPVLAEGRYGSPAAVRHAFDAGAHAVVVGTAITDPVALTWRFAAAAREGVHGAA